LTKRTQAYQVRDKETGRVFARYTVSVPEDWDDDMCLFCVNESSWCSSNMLEEPERVEVLNRQLWESHVAEHLGDDCLCGYVDFELFLQS